MKKKNVVEATINLIETQPLKSKDIKRKVTSLFFKDYNYYITLKT